MKTAPRQFQYVWLNFNYRLDNFNSNTYNYVGDVGVKYIYSRYFLITVSHGGIPIKKRINIHSENSDMYSDGLIMGYDSWIYKYFPQIWSLIQNSTEHGVLIQEFIKLTTFDKKAVLDINTTHNQKNSFIEMHYFGDFDKMLQMFFLQLQTQVGVSQRTMRQIEFMILAEFDVSRVLIDEI